MKNVSKLVRQQRKVATIYPKSEDVFRAFKLAPYTSVRVVIVGQDPYHNGHADGLAFSSRDTSIPASLKVIFKEIEKDLGVQVQKSPDLTRWAQQGVFLINSSLTVRAGDAGSHSGLGWEKFVGKAINYLSLSPTPTVFMLWGSKAKSFKKYIEEQNHLILEAYHPASELYSGGSSGFYGCKHFSKSNNFLKNNNLKTINWT